MEEGDMEKELEGCRVKGCGKSMEG